MIVGANAIALGVAWWQDWSLLFLLFTYWVQSIVIGWYSARRILALRRFSTERTRGFSGSSDSVIKRKAAAFFALHYGLFHCFYLFFIFMQSVRHSALEDVSALDGAWLGAIGFTFLLTHGASFRRNLEYDRRGCPNIGTLFFLPYARIVPMHLMVVLGLMLDYTDAILAFAVLKTGADVLMHWVEHRILAKSGVESAA